jgi:isopentenyldiphosphate isomerase
MNKNGSGAVADAAISCKGLWKASPAKPKLYRCFEAWTWNSGGKFLLHRRGLGSGKSTFCPFWAVSSALRPGSSG